MTVEEAVQEVVDRGYHYISRPRIERWVLRCHKRLCNKHPWPFLRTTTEGIAPLTITDLGKVLDVNDLTARENLDPSDARIVRREDPTLAATGTPEAWYLEGQETLRTWPGSSDTIRVDYARRVGDLKPSDELLGPSEFHELVIDWVVTYCLKDDDEYDEARALKEDVEEGAAEMFRTLMVRNRQRPRLMTRTGPAGSYL